MNRRPPLEYLLGRSTRERWHPRYTWNVVLFRQRGISLVVLSVLAVLPVSGTVCAALCMPAAKATSASHEHQASHEHHASAQPSHEPVAGQQRVEGTSGHDCGRHNGPTHEATATLTAAVRSSDISLISVTQLVGPGTPNVFALISVRTHSGSSPPGPAAPTRAPLVLRI
jgi:hypothetical protein